MARSLSISMIVRNEERHLGRALKNVWVFADEIIVLDTGSIDRTREIARDSLATVYDFDWCDDFAKARNKSLHYCTKDLVMWLDADDIIELQDAERLKEVIAQDAGWDVLHLPYQYSPTLRKKPPRIFRNKIGARWIYPIHEKLQFPPGSRHKKDIENICISHNPLRSRTANSRFYLSILEKVVKTNEFKDSNYMLWHIAKEYSNLRNQTQSIRYFKEAIANGSGVSCYTLSRQYLGLARQFRRQGEYFAAMSALGTAASLYSDWREPYCGLAEILLAIGDPFAASVCIERAGCIIQHSLGIERIDLYDDKKFKKDFIERTKACLDRGQISEPLVPDGSIKTHKLVAGGDVCLARQMQGYVSTYGVHWPFANISSILKSADISLVNLECVLSTKGTRIDKGGRRPFYYRGHPQLVDVLVSAGINAVTVSNNHAMDFGADALLQQLKILDVSGLCYTGAGKTMLEALAPKYLVVGNLSVALIGIETEESFVRATHASPGVNHAKGKMAILQHMLTSIMQAREHADLIVVSPHWGANWSERPTSQQRELARQIIDLGADAILGHSAHILQGVEVYQGRPIVYDMGCLLFDRVQENRMSLSAMFELDFSSVGFSRLVIRPVELESGRVTIPSASKSEEILKLIQMLSDELSILPWQHADGCLSLSLTPVNRGLSSGRPKTSGARSCTLGVRCLPDEILSIKSAGEVDVLPGYVDFVDNSEVVLMGSQIPGQVRPGRAFIVEILLRVAGPLMGRWEGRISAYSQNKQRIFRWTHPISDGDVCPRSWKPGQLIVDNTCVRPPRECSAGLYELYFELVDKGSRRTICPLSNRRKYDNAVFIGQILATPSAAGGVAGLENGGS